MQISTSFCIPNRVVITNNLASLTLNIIAGFQCVSSSKRQNISGQKEPSTCLKPEIVEEKEVDLIISDIMMPVKIGITLCKEIKENININFSHIPFIMLTAKGGLENQKEHYARNYFVDSKELAVNPTSRTTNS